MTTETMRRRPVGGASHRSWWPWVAGLLVATLIVVVTLVLYMRRDDVGSSRSAAVPVAGPAVATTSPAQAMSAGEPQRGGSRDRARSPIAAIAAERKRLREQGEALGARMRSEAISRYAGETPDPAWAGSKQQALAMIADDLAEQGMPVPPDLGIDCKRSICKITASFADDAAADRWAMFYMASLGAATSRSVVSTVITPEGRSGIEIYSMARL